MKHAGIGWPENAGGEHPNAETILGMPGILHGCTLICSPSARYWYRQARGASPLVVWRAIPRQGSLPAQLNWIGKRIADECLNLWDKSDDAPGAVHGGIEHFTPLNELQFSKEAGEDFRSYAETASKLSNVRIALRQRFQERGQTVRLMFPAWVPMDDMARLSEWEDEARQWDTIGLHCYGSAETMLDRYESYRRAFPGKPIFIGEWNSNHEDHDERESLDMWATVAGYDPLFLGATYFIWETNNSGEHDLSIWGNTDRLALFRDPPVVAQPEPAPIPDPIPEPVMTEYEQFIRDAAQKRGIDPDIAVRVANSEGSVTEPARRGTFDTGSSWWAFQLHYGGPGYEQYGTAAGMGTGFTELTGWQPGDPAAWKDATRYALNRAKAVGWGAWYGAAHVGIGQWDGIDRNRVWNAQSETWDYEAGVTPVPTPGLAYNPNQPPERQIQDWACSIRTTAWMLKSLGIDADAGALQNEMVPTYVTPQDGLLDGRGQGLAEIIRRHLPPGTAVDVSWAPSWETVSAQAGRGPIGLGSGGLYHWIAVADVIDGATLKTANPAPNYPPGDPLGDRLTRAQFDRWAPWAMVSVPILQEVDEVTVAEADALRAENARLQAQVNSFVNAVAYLGDDQGDRLQSVVNELRRVRVESVGPRPS